MYRASECHRFILVFRDEVTNYLVTIVLYRGNKVGEVLINHIFHKQGPYSYFIYDEDQVFYPVLCCIFKKD